MSDNKFFRQRFWLEILSITVIFYCGTAVMFRRLQGYWNTERILIVLFLCTVPISLWMTAFAGHFTLRRTCESSAATVAIARRQLVWSYVGEIVFRQRWILLTLIWLCSALFPVAIIHNVRENAYFMEFTVDPRDGFLPDTVLLVAMLVVGGILGLGIGMMLITSGVLGAYRTNGIALPLWQTMFNFGLMIAILHIWTTVDLDLITSIKPLLIGIGLASIPIVASAGIARWSRTPMASLLTMPTQLAANCVSIGLGTGISGIILLPFVIVILILSGDGSLESDLSVPATIALFVPLVILLAVNWRNMLYVQLVFILTWVGINFGFRFIEGLIGSYAIESFWWFNFCGIALVVLTCAFYNVDRATNQLSPKN